MLALRKPLLRKKKALNKPGSGWRTYASRKRTAGRNWMRCGLVFVKLRQPSPRLMRSLHGSAVCWAP